MGASRLPWATALVVAGWCGGCASTPEDVLPTRTTPLATLEVTEPCALATGYLVARRGDLSVGPFVDDSQGSEHKLWVASQRPGPDNATLVVTGPNGHTETQARGLANATVSNAAQFWAGEIATPADGEYRIDVTVGPDHLCATARFTHGS